MDEASERRQDFSAIPGTQECLCSSQTDLARCTRPCSKRGTKSKCAHPTLHEASKRLDEHDQELHTALLRSPSAIGSKAVERPVPYSSDQHR